jgi:hypothetical protein
MDCRELPGVLVHYLSVLPANQGNKIILKREITLLITKIIDIAGPGYVGIGEIGKIKSIFNEPLPGGLCFAIRI